jgi:cytochrome P450
LASTSVESVQLTAQQRSLTVGQRLIAAVTTWATSPRVLRFGCAVLRHLAPVLVLGKRAFVVRHDDVIEVLTRDRDFTIAEINGQRTERSNGPFVLSLDRGAQHDREKALLNAVVLREDLERVRSIVVGAAQRCVESAEPRGRIDLVQELTRVVPLRVIEHYFGVPGPSDAVMQRWLRALFQELFLNATDDQDVVLAGVAAFNELRPYLLDLIPRRRKELATRGEAPNDVLGRMIAFQTQEPYRSWLDDDAIARNISGLIIGALETTSKAAILVVEELFRRPSALERAKQLAFDDNQEGLRDYVLEALRFNPFAPVVTRYCASDAALGTGRGLPRKVPAGTTVFAVTLSAMFDPEAVARPGAFRPGRRMDYLHFGYGLHRCQGHLINHVQVPELVGAVLRLQGLRRIPDAQGDIAYDGPFPDRFVVQFDASTEKTS